MNSFSSDHFYNPNRPAGVDPVTASAPRHDGTQHAFAPPTFPTGLNYQPPAQPAQTEEKKPRKKAGPTGPAYRLFLTPTRHGRFVRAAGLAMIGCHIASLTFPGGSWVSVLVPVRAVALFPAVLALFMVRLTGCHVGRRTARTRLGELAAHFGRIGALFAVGWYCLAAFLYAEAYMWAVGSDGGFGWIETGRPYERPWMNERPVVMRTVFVIIGLGLGIRHLFLDLDRIPFPARRFNGGNPVRLGTPVERIQARVWSAGWASVAVSVALASAGLVLYYLTLRQVAWRVAFSILYWPLNLPWAYRPGRFRGVYELVFRHCIGQAAMCGLTLGFADLCFTEFQVQPPFRNGRFITDGSSNRNTSLLLGLQSRAELQVTSAFYELATIAYTPGSRRVSVFTELVDPRKRDTPTWESILFECTKRVALLSERIAYARTRGDAPVLSARPEEKKKARDAENEEAEKAKLRQRTPQKLKEKSILEAPLRAGKLEAVVQGVQTYAALTAPEPDAYEADRADATGHSYGDRLMEALPVRDIVVEAVSVDVAGFVAWVSNSAIGSIVYADPARLVTATVCAGPISDAVVTIDAVEALSQLAIAATDEDEYGRVYKSTRTIIRMLSNALVDIETFIADVMPDSTIPIVRPAGMADPTGANEAYAYYDPPQFRPAVLENEELEDPLAIRDCLRENLRDLVRHFEPHRVKIDLPHRELDDLLRLVNMS